MTGVGGAWPPRTGALHLTAAGASAGMCGGYDVLLMAWSPCQDSFPAAGHIPGLRNRHLCYNRI